MEGDRAMKVQILSSNVLTKDIPARGEKAAISFKEQQAAIIKEDGFPKPFRISLQPMQHPYPPGMYTFHPDSFVTDEYERLKFARDVTLVLLPASAQAQAQAKA